MIKQIVKCVAFSAIVLVASCAKDLTPQELIAKANQDIAAGNFAAANISLKNAAVKEPNNAEVRLDLAVVALVFGDGLTAEKEARRALDLGIPADKVTLLLLRAIYLQGDNDRLVAETETVAESLDPKDKADILAYRAYALINQQKYKLAEPVIEQALALNDKSVMAILAKASYEAQLGRREPAMALANQAVAIDPTSADGWSLIGDLNAADGKLNEAKDAYDKAIAQLQYVSMTTARRAFVVAELEDYAAARSDIGALFTSGFGANAYVNFVAGYIEFKQAAYPAATQALEKSVGADPNNLLSKLYLAASYIQEGKLEQARVIANQLLSAIPNSVEVARMLASLSIKQQDFSAARSTLGVLLETDENDTVALGMMGTIALMEGKSDEAIEYLQRLATVSPDNTAVPQMLEVAKTMRGDYISKLSAAAEQKVPPEEYDQALLSAATALKQGHLIEARTIAENLQQQFPNKIEPLKMLATIYLAAGNWPKGKELLERALAIDSTDPSTIKTLAKIDLRIGEAPRAEELVSAYLKNHPDDKEAVGIQSEIIVATENFQQAEKRLIELLDHDPDNLELEARLVKLYFDNGKFEQVSVKTAGLSDETFRAQPSLIELRGKALFALGDMQGTKKTWEKWVKLAPDSVLANYYYADNLARSNQLPQALEYLERSRKHNSDYLPTRIAIIRLSAEMGDADKALAEMAKLQSEMKEDRAEVWYTQGWLNAKLGKYPAAEEALRKSLTMQPNPEAVMLLFASLSSQGKEKEAMASLEEWVGKLPQNISLMGVLGQSYLGRKEPEKAIGVYEKILTIDPDSVLALNNLAWLKRKTDAKQALVYAERASKLAPEDPYVMSTYATLLAGNGKAAEGEEMMRKAVALHPDSLQAKLDLGRLLLDLGKPGDAKPYLEEVVGSNGSASLVAEAKIFLRQQRRAASS